MLKLVQLIKMSDIEHMQEGLDVMSGLLFVLGL